jgi:plastocyanin domain-containing protein
MLELLNKYKKQIAYIIVGLFLLYGIIWITTRKPQIPAEYKAAIDSLTKANAALAAQQKQLDSTITVYEGEVKEIDFQIDNIKEKTTIVKEFHHEVIERVNHYDNKQIDSFFKVRYNY